jgi:hypothetical protein
MNYKLILLVLVTLFIGANLMCSCCRYPVFDYLMGRKVREGAETREVGPPGSKQSTNTASKDVVDMVNEQRPVPDIVAATADTVKQAKKGGATTGMTGTTGMKEGFLNAGGLPAAFNSGLSVLSGGNIDGFKIEPAPRPEVIPVKKDGREGMALMGSDINEVQNGDVAGMWVTKANTYASEFGYGIINNTGSAYSADEPLKNGELVLFAKNKFKPECCPAPYSSSTGCVCMTPEQINYLNTRGGNRTSDSGV